MRKATTTTVGLAAALPARPMTGAATRFGAKVLLASVLLSGTVPASAAHLACKQHSTFGVGRGPTLGIAMDHAIQNWRMRTAGAYGAAYGNYYNALNYGRRCNRTGGLTYCRVWANPCR
jgi:hypothetical protein